VLVIVVYLISYRGHLDLIEALGRIAGKCCSIRGLWPSGWTGLGAAVRLRADALGIAGHVSLLGGRFDIPDLLHASDIELLASHQKGFSIAVIEGMSAGPSKIVMDVVGNADRFFV
jgi:hypothetical protein